MQLSSQNSNTLFFALKIPFRFVPSPLSHLATPFFFIPRTTANADKLPRTVCVPAISTMSTADEFKAIGNKAIADKNFDEAMYVSSTLTIRCYHVDPSYATPA